MAEESRAAGLFGSSLDFLQKSLGGTANTAIGLGGALLTGQQNLTAYSGALAENTKAFGDFGSAMGKVVNGLAKFAEASLAEYQALTGIGATFGKEIKDIKVAAAELGLSVEDMTSFLKKNSESLRSFGGSTDVAIARFKALSNTVLDSRELGTELRRLGFTTKDINENLALYGELTNANSRQDRLSVQEQAEAAKGLMVELDGLAKLTGKQRDQIADEMRERRRQGDINAYLMGKSAEEQEKFMLEYEKIAGTLGEDAANLFADMALRGAPTTETTKGAYLAMGEGARASLEQAVANFDSGNLDAFADSMAKARGAAIDFQNTEEFRNTAILGGMTQISGAFANASGAAIDYKKGIESTRDGTMSAAEAEKQIRDQIEQQQLVQMKQVTGVFDKTIDIQENLRTITTQVMEETIPHIENVAIAGLEKMQAAMPSADQISDGIVQGVNALFQVAGLEDRQSAVLNAQDATTAAVNEVAEASRQTGSEIIDSTEKNTKQINDSLWNSKEDLLMSMDVVAEKVDQSKIDTLKAIAEAQKFTQGKIDAYQKSGKILGGFAEGGSIGPNEYGIVGEAGPEFIGGPAQVMSAKTSMGVMQTLMKSIRALDTSVQESQSNAQNQLSNIIQGNTGGNLNDQKLDTMISLLSQIVQVENIAVGTQRKTMKATRGLQGNLLRGV